jgi:hypothetical protein
MEPIIECPNCNAIKNWCDNCMAITLAKEAKEYDELIKTILSIKKPVVK